MHLDVRGCITFFPHLQALCETLEERCYTLKRELKERDTRIQLLEEEVALHKAEVENLRKSLR